MTSSPATSVAAAAAGFDRRSGSLIERALFNHRALIGLLCFSITLLLGWQASRLQIAASFEKTIPGSHPFIAAYRAHQGDLRGLGNAVRVALASRGGTIYDARYLDTLRRLSDELYLLPGVDRNSMKSLWTPTTRWNGVTEDGLEGGPVIPDG